MDDIVKRAMLKWPDVPDVYGWLRLDRRGDWQVRTASGQFDRMRNPSIVEFIGRNYAADAQGQWFFQNGPQRVYVELEATPLVWRIQPDLSVQDHIGRNALVQDALVDELGHLYLATNRGFGLVHTQDVGLAADAIEQGLWQVQEDTQARLPVRFGYLQSPQTLHNR